MMTTFAADLTSTLAPFGWGAAAFVMMGLGAVVTALIVAGGTAPAVPTQAATSESERDMLRRAA